MSRRPPSFIKEIEQEFKTLVRQTLSLSGIHYEEDALKLYTEREDGNHIGLAFDMSPCSDETTSPQKCPGTKCAKKTPQDEPEDEDIGTLIVGTIGKHLSQIGLVPLETRGPQVLIVAVEDCKHSLTLLEQARVAAGAACLQESIKRAHEYAYGIATMWFGPKRGIHVARKAHDRANEGRKDLENSLESLGSLNLI